MAEKVKQYIVYTLLALGVLPLFFIVNQPSSWTLEPDNYRQLATYLSAVLGYAGIYLLTWELILGTRSISGVLFKDLTSKLSLHSKLGKYGLLFIFLHPILIAYYYGEGFLYSFMPNLSDEFERHVTFGRFALFGLIIIWVTSAILRKKIAYRPWKYIHYISYPTLLFALLHVPEIGSSFSQQLIRIYWYIIVAVVLICLALRMRHIFGFSKREYKITGHRQLSEKIWIVDMMPVSKNLRVRTGQYVYLQPSLFSEEHPFSVLNHNDEDGSISIGYKVFGKFTEKLSTAKVGDNVLIDGPYGTFTNEINVNPNKPAVFIAGGIGVTPFAKHCLDKRGDRVLFYAVRTPQSPAFKNILEPVMGDKLVMVVEKDDSPATPNDERGFLDKEIITKYIDQSTPYEFYICGPEKMMKDIKRQLLQMNIPEKRIHLESFAY